MKILTEYDAENFLEHEGFPLIQRKLCKTERDALKTAKTYCFPVVLKASSPTLLHKTEHNAVRTNVTEKNFHQHYTELMKLHPEGILVQPHIEGIPLLLGIKKDPTFGHVLAVGLGDIYTEIFKDVTFRILPANKKEILSMLDDLKSAQLFHTYRNKKIDIKKLNKILLTLSKLPEKYPNLEELDINPLFLNNYEATIADARIVLE